MAGGLGDGLAGAAICRNGMDQPQTGIGPADKGDAFAVGGPCGIGFHRFVIIGQATRFATGHRFDPQFAKRFEQHLAAIG